MLWCTCSENRLIEGSCSVCLLRMMLKKNISDLRTPGFAALALAFASFGDAFLYPYLPLKSADVGIPVVWVGMLLSINRFIRIFTNTLIVNLFSKYGLRLVTIVAVVFAIVSTAGYGLASGIISWIVLRVLWGLSFSA